MIYGYGNGCMCQLGQKKAFNTHKPTEIILNILDNEKNKISINTEKINQISCGCYHTIIKTSTSKIYSFGVNDEGALGRLTEEEIPLPVDLPKKIGRIKRIVTTDDASFILTSKGDLYGCGTFKSSKGVEGFNEKVKKQMEFLKINTNIKFSEVVAGGAHILLISSDNHLYGMGSSEYGQLLIKERLTNLRKLSFRKKNEFNKKVIENSIELKPKEKILKIFAGTYTSFIKTTSQIIAFGRNTTSELGTNESIEKYIEIFKGKSKDIKNIKGGEGHTLFLMRNGDVYSSGNNLFGQCGTGDNKDVNKPTLINNSFKNEKILNIEANGNFSLLLTENQKFISFGLNTSGELGYSQDEEVKNEVREVPFKIKTVKSFSIGNDFVIFDGNL